MTDSTRSSKPTLRLSPAAKVVLDEYLDAERDRVIREASNLRRSAGPLTGRDIVNAWEALQERDRAKPISSAPNIALEAAPVNRGGVFLGAFVAVVVGATALAFASILPALAPDLQLSPAFRSALATVAGGLAALGIAGMIVAIFRRLLSARLRRVHLSAPLSEQTYQEAHGASFVLQWSSIERGLRQLAAVSLGMPESDAKRYPVGELLRALSRSNVISERFYDRTRQALATRSAILHGNGASETDLREASKGLEGLGGEIRDLVRKHLEDRSISSRSGGRQRAAQAFVAEVGSDWAVKVSGDVVSGPFSTQTQAIDGARGWLLANGGGELVVLGTNGKIRQKDTIGRPDPRGGG